MAEPVLNTGEESLPGNMGTGQPSTGNPNLTTKQQRMHSALKLKAQARMRQEQEDSGMTPEEWAQTQREKWRWSAGTTKGLLQSAADLAADFNAGLFSLLGPTVQDAIAEIGLGRRHNEDPYMGILGRGAEVVGQAMPMALGGSAALGVGKAASSALPGFIGMRGVGESSVRAGLALNASTPVRAGLSLSAIKDNVGGTGARILQDILRTAETNPGMFMGAEIGGGMGAGMSEEAVRQSTGSEEGTGLASLAGGMAGGAIPVVGLNFTRQAANWALLHLAPWTEASGELYAARRIQKLAGAAGSDQDLRRFSLAEKVRTGRKGVSPARRTEDQNLLALESRVIEDNPELALQFTEALAGARRIAQQELRDEVGELRMPGEWERMVIERAAVPGTVIKEDEPIKMLEQAYESFRPLYQEFAGYPIRPQVETLEGTMSFPQVFTASIADPSVLASNSERKTAQRFLEDELSRLSPSTLDRDPTIDSSAMLTVRQNIRDRVRELMASGDRSERAQAIILSNAEAALTGALQQQLPAGALNTMAQIDNQYNVYHVIERAVYTAGERPLSTQVLGKAVRDSVPPDQARDLRTLVRSGQNVESVIGDPAKAKALVRGQDPKTVAVMQAEFLDALWQRSLLRNATDDGEQVISGKRLLASLSAERSTATALGMDKQRYERMVTIAREIQGMEMKSPKEVDKLLSEGPSSILELLATLVGVHSAQSVKPGGPGALVLAGFFARSARKRLGMLFGDEASKILIAAHKDPELYAALLVKPTSPVSEQDKAARVINAWLYNSGETALEEGQE